MVLVTEITEVLLVAFFISSITVLFLLLLSPAVSPCELLLPLVVLFSVTLVIPLFEVPFVFSSGTRSSLV